MVGRRIRVVKNGWGFPEGVCGRVVERYGNWWTVDFGVRKIAGFAGTLHNGRVISSTAGTRWNFDPSEIALCEEEAVLEMLKLYEG